MAFWLWAATEHLHYRIFVMTLNRFMNIICYVKIKGVKKFLLSIGVSSLSLISSKIFQRGSFHRSDKALAKTHVILSASLYWVISRDFGSSKIQFLQFIHHSQIASRNRLLYSVCNGVIIFEILSKLYSCTIWTMWSNSD